MFDKKTLDSYLKSDYKRYGRWRPTLKDRILHNEGWYIWQYVKHMRYVEYHRSKGGLHKIFFLWHWYKLKHLQFKLHIAIHPGTVGPGFRIYHVGNYTHVSPNVKIGKNCTIISGVVFGNKSENLNKIPVTVGDNCVFGLDCKILGSVKIGNNVTIGANAIITKDIPDNAIVVGVNKIIGYKGLNDI